jgi:hypothetical protein
LNSTHCLRSGLMLKCQDPDSRILNLEPRSLQLAAPISWPASLGNYCC